MPKFEKGSAEAREWAEKMKEARNAKRRASGKAAVKEKHETNVGIAEKSAAAYKKRQAAMSPEERKEREKSKAALKARIEADKKKASPSSAAPAEVKKVQKAVKKRAAEEGVKVAEPAPAKVKTFDAMTLKELKAAVKEARKVMCPPVGKMKQVALMREIDRLNKAGGTFDVIASVKDRRVGELRKELRELRRKHCPPVSKMRKAALLVEALALKEAAAKLEAAPVPTLEEYEQGRREAKEETKPMLAEMRRARAAARAMEKRAAKKEEKQTAIAKKAAAEVKPEEVMPKEEAIKEFLAPEPAKTEAKPQKFRISTDESKPTIVKGLDNLIEELNLNYMYALSVEGATTKIGDFKKRIDKVLKSKYTNKNTTFAVHRKTNINGDTYFVKEVKSEAAPAPAPKPEAKAEFDTSKLYYTEVGKESYGHIVYVYHVENGTAHAVANRPVPGQWRKDEGSYPVDKKMMITVSPTEKEKLHPFSSLQEKGNMDALRRIVMKEPAPAPAPKTEDKAKADRKKVFQGKAKAAAAKKKV